MKRFCTILILLKITLLSSQISAEDVNTTQLKGLLWRDSETKEILFKSEDIIAFDWDNQIFLLKTDSILDFLSWIPPHKYQYRSLYVEDANGPIYDAKWVNHISSMGFNGPIFNFTNPFISIEDGYPNSIVDKNDIRYNKRLLEGLRKLLFLKVLAIIERYSDWK